MLSQQINEIELLFRSVENLVRELRDDCKNNSAEENTAHCALKLAVTMEEQTKVLSSMVYCAVVWKQNSDHRE